MSNSESEKTERYLYAITCFDDLSCGMVENGTRFGGSIKRMEYYDEHKAYGAETSDPKSLNFIRKIAAGPFESDDGKYMIGSLLLVEATREEAENFNRNDPFYRNGVWEKVTINRWVSAGGIRAVDAVMEGER